MRLFQFAALIVRSGARTFKKVECVGICVLFGSMKNVNLWQNAMRRVGANECIYSLRDCIGALDSFWEFDLYLLYAFLLTFYLDRLCACVF